MREGGREGGRGGMRMMKKRVYKAKTISRALGATKNILRERRQGRQKRG